MFFEFLKKHWLFFTISALVTITLFSIMFGIVPAVVFIIAEFLVVWFFFTITD